MTPSGREIRKRLVAIIENMMALSLGNAFQLTHPSTGMGKWSPSVELAMGLTLNGGSV